MVKNLENTSLRNKFCFLDHTLDLAFLIGKKKKTNKQTKYEIKHKLLNTSLHQEKVLSNG